MILILFFSDNHPLRFEPPDQNPYFLLFETGLWPFRFFQIQNSIPPKDSFHPNWLDDSSLMLRTSLLLGHTDLTALKGDPCSIGPVRFVNKKRAKKIARNISKNTAIVIDEHFVPSFKPSKVFIEQVKVSDKVKIANK